jgi:hypothetical protein
MPAKCIVEECKEQHDPQNIQKRADGSIGEFEIAVEKVLK